MTTIFTDDFAYSEVDISIGESAIGHTGRELIIESFDGCEFRVTLNDSRFNQLADQLLLAGYAQIDRSKEAR